MNGVKYICKALYKKEVVCPHKTKKPDERCRTCDYSEMMG